jgi:hypothetical protein
VRPSPPPRYVYIIIVKKLINKSIPSCGTMRMHRGLYCTALLLVCASSSARSPLTLCVSILGPLQTYINTRTQYNNGALPVRRTRAKVRSVGRAVPNSAPAGRDTGLGSGLTAGQQSRAAPWPARVQAPAPAAASSSSRYNTSSSSRSRQCLGGSVPGRRPRAVHADPPPCKRPPRNTDARPPSWSG